MSVEKRSVVNIRDVDFSKRKIRRPRHPYNVEQEPYQIQPHFIAQTIGGETLVSLRDQSRVVTDPVLNKLIGWWVEKHYFYVKLHQLAHSGFVKMLTNEDQDPGSTLGTAADVKTFHNNAKVDWTKECLEQVSAKWFRDAGETWNVPAIDGLPLAQLSRRNWANSLITETAYEAFDQTVPHTAGSPDTSEAREIEVAMQTWRFMTEVEKEKWTYSDWLADQGIRDPDMIEFETEAPELLGSFVEWSYPTNTVDVTDGTVTSAVVWSMNNTIKNKFMKDPGFILGVTVIKPKMYWIGQKGTMLDLLNHAFQWSPTVMDEFPSSSLIGHAASTVPLAAITGDAIVYDHKDLLMYGEQFVNHVIDENDNGINIPEADADRLYPVTADLDALFVTPIGKNLIRQDGVVSCRIKTRIEDTT